jgi:two-component system sensor histidine kinase DctS
VLFQAILPLLNLQASREHIQVVMHVDADCPPALCDRTMIEQVLLNLARNGMQAMPPEHPPSSSGLRVLTLQARSLAAQGTRSWLAFSVTDHGAGLTPEVAERLFTPFFTTKAEGMGLGLSLCRTVVEQHGGALTHMPAQPRGTVFMFTLPAALPPN